MASEEEKIDFSVFGKELLQMPPHIHQVYGSLLNNGLYVTQPDCLMEVDVVRYSMHVPFWTSEVSLCAKPSGGLCRLVHWK